MTVYLRLSLWWFPRWRMTPSRWQVKDPRHA